MTEVWKSAASLLVLAVGIGVTPLATSAQTSGDRPTLTEVTKETAEALRALGDYAAGQRDQALQKAKVILADLDARIDQLEARLDEQWERMDQPTREKARAARKALRRQRNDLAEWYGGLQRSTVDAWGHVREGFLASYQRLRQAFVEAAREF